VAGLYLNAFVLVAQLFLRVPALRALVLTQQESPFLFTQVFVLAMFVLLGRAAQMGFAAHVAPGLERAAARPPAAIP